MAGGGRQSSWSVHARTRDTYEEDERSPTDTPPCREWLYSGRERERFPVDSLCFHPLVEPEICHSDAEPGDQTSSGGEAGEPAKDFVGIVLDRQVSKECKARAESDGNMG